MVRTSWEKAVSPVSGSLESADTLARAFPPAKSLSKPGQRHEDDKRETPWSGCTEALVHECPPIDEEEPAAACEGPSTSPA